MNVIGKASYKGRTYRLLYAGTTKYGQKAKLAFMDGSKEFWADLALVQITQRYERPKSLSKILDYAKHVGEVKCRKCGQWTPEGDDWCMACGSADYEY